jgi:perosamine synthetase
MSAIIPFHKPYIDNSEAQEVFKALKSGWITMGPRVKDFENQFASYLGVKHAIALSSCTAGLHLGLVVAGVKAGDEVLTTPYTFTATAEAIIYQGARPVFVDISKKTLNLEPSLIAARISKKTKAIIPVHLAGVPCDMIPIMKSAKRHGFKVIEDAAHALPSKYNGRNIGTFGDITCFSFHATKNLTTGEGGMVTTNSDEYDQRIRLLRLHGLSKTAMERKADKRFWQYEVMDSGFKYNMSDIQAALGIAQLSKLDAMQKLREKVAKAYLEGLADAVQIKLPYVDGSIKPSWHLFIIQLELEHLKTSRDEFMLLLKEEGIETNLHYKPLHMHKFYCEKYGFKPEDFPNAKYVYERAVSLPIYPGLTKGQVGRIIHSIKKIMNKYAR